MLIMKGLFEDVWAGRDTVTVEDCGDITLPVRLREKLSANVRSFSTAFRLHYLSSVSQVRTFTL